MLDLQKVSGNITLEINVEEVNMHLEDVQNYFRMYTHGTINPSRKEMREIFKRTYQLARLVYGLKLVLVHGLNYDYENNSDECIADEKQHFQNNDKKLYELEMNLRCMEDERNYAKETYERLNNTKLNWTCTEGGKEVKH